MHNYAYQAIGMCISSAPNTRAEHMPHQDEKQQYRCDDGYYLVIGSAGTQCV